MMVPECDDSYHHVHATEHEIENEEKEVALIFHAYTVVNPWAVMVHEIHTLLANGAVVSAGWFDDFARVTFLRPELFQLCRCLATIAKQLLDITRESLKKLIVALVSHINFLPEGTILLL